MENKIYIFLTGWCAGVLMSIFLLIPLVYSRLEPCRSFESRFEGATFVEIGDTCYLEHTNPNWVGGEPLMLDKLFVIDEDEPWEELSYRIISHGGKVK